MPSTVVHMAVAGLIGAALLGTAFDRRSVLILFGAMIAADLDSFVGLVSVVGHRTAFHTLLVPITAAVVLLVDLRRGEGSWVRRRWGPRGVRITWVTIVAYAGAAIGLDLFSAGGANPLWPLHDQFYAIDGTIELSSRRGIVQTFVDLGSERGGDASSSETVARGTSRDVNVSTGIDPNPDGGDTAGPVDRVFPVVRSGWQLLVLVVGTTVTAARFYVDQTVPAE
nr:metal-dependent hydrolase [Halomicrobium sp. LC1Hm]